MFIHCQAKLAKATTLSSWPLLAGKQQVKFMGTSVVHATAWASIYSCSLSQLPCCLKYNLCQTGTHSHLPVYHCLQHLTSCRGVATWHLGPSHKIYGSRAHSPNIWCSTAPSACRRSYMHKASISRARTMFSQHASIRSKGIYWTGLHAAKCVARTHFSNSIFVCIHTGHAAPCRHNM